MKTTLLSCRALADVASPVSIASARRRTEVILRRYRVFPGDWVDSPPNTPVSTDPLRYLLDRLAGTTGAPSNTLDRDGLEQARRFGWVYEYQGREALTGVGAYHAGETSGGMLGGSPSVPEVVAVSSRRRELVVGGPAVSDLMFWAIRCDLGLLLSQWSVGHHPWLGAAG